MPGPRSVIDPPMRRAPLQTLISAARTDPGGVRWENGVEWTPELCGGHGGILPIQCGPYVDEQDAPLKTPTGSGGTETFDPYLVWASRVCNAGAVVDDLVTGLRRALDVDQHRQIENEFWSGTLNGTVNNYLANPNSVDTLNGGVATPLAWALADLQQAMASNIPGGLGVIHGTVRTVTLWGLLGLVVKDGTALVDLYGNRVVPGAGYNGDGPDGPTPDTTTAWAYGTGPVEARIGEDLVLDDLDRDTNRRIVTIERPAGAWFDPCTHYGINVDLCSTSCAVEEG